MKVVISEFMDLPAVEALKGRFDTVYDPQLVDDRPGLASLLADADALVVAIAPRSTPRWSPARHG